jgi:hypothetical protein
MIRQDLVALKYRLKHAVTREQRRKVIDSFPELRGWPISRVRGILKADRILQGKRGPRWLNSF